MIKQFFIGFIAGFMLAAIIFCFVAALFYVRNRDKEVLEYAERQIEIEALREDYISRDPFEFLDDVPGVRRSADDAIAEFERKRDEVLQQFRDRLSSRARHAD
jgi:cbb3-type cytochrome oxidase subunit 3